jgi:hypothetical protein
MVVIRLDGEVVDWGMWIKGKQKVMPNPMFPNWPKARPVSGRRFSFHAIINSVQAHQIILLFLD